MRLILGHSYNRKQLYLSVLFCFLKCISTQMQYKAFNGFHCKSTEIASMYVRPQVFFCNVTPLHCIGGLLLPLIVSCT